MKPEKELADDLGLSRPSIRALRKEHLTEGPDWARADKDMVVYTAAGAKKLAGLLHVSPSEKKTDGGAALFAGVAADGSPSLALTVTRHRIGRNDRLIEAKAEDGEVLLVRVHSNVNYRPGMPVHAKMERHGHAVIAGRSPRFPGRY